MNKNNHFTLDFAVFSTVVAGAAAFPPHAAFLLRALAIATEIITSISSSSSGPLNLEMLTKMESLFDTTNFVNQKPLRKYEPLIRLDIDGNPLPRRLLNGIKSEDSVRPESKVEPERKVEPEQKAEPERKMVPKSDKTSPPEDLKRKVQEPPAKALEPARKKQTSIMNFFKKT